MGAARAVADAELMRRRDSARGTALDREDLYLFMESYQNNIELTTTMLARQDVLNANIEKAIAELVNICGNQARILEALQKHGDDCGANYHDAMAVLEAARLDEVKAHSGHNNRIYVALVGMGVIIISLIGVLAKVVL